MYCIPPSCHLILGNVNVVLITIYKIRMKRSVRPVHYRGIFYPCIIMKRRNVYSFFNDAIFASLIATTVHFLKNRLNSFFTFPETLKEVIFVIIIVNASTCVFKL